MKHNCEQDSMELSFPATEVEASVGIAKLRNQLTAHGLPAARADDVKIALAEAINNVVEHAYAGMPPETVHINCMMCRETLEVRIEDTGHPMPGLKPPDGKPPVIGNIRQDLPEGGFGWFLIHQLASKIKYERHKGYNRLSLWFDFPKSA
ncbi:ATP-binding protein [Ruegeria arenilitoris]|uniref:ATP-binding protein n=1 Tax=Ruegeria arenilitoris TaxID=1173585 RepID=UPI003463BFE3